MNTQHVSDILVAEDSPELRAMYRMILEDAGYSVRTAASGEEALEFARDRRPDLMIVDVIMPGMDGLELLMHVRSNFVPPIPPAIVCSGFDITEDEAMRRGASLFLRKPFDPDDLLHFVRLGLRGHQPDAATSEAGRARTSAARRRAEEAATAEITRLALGHEHASAGVLSWIAGYFGVENAIIVLLRDGALQVIGANNFAEFDLGAAIEDRLPFCAQIVETGSSLFLADVDAHPTFGAEPTMLHGIRSFAGVPLFTSGQVAIGVFCLFDAAPRALPAEDACLLELLGRIGSRSLLQREQQIRAPGVPHFDASLVMLPETFGAFLDTEIRLLNRLGGTLDIVVLELATDVMAEVIALCRRVTRIERFGLSVISANRLALYKRSQTATTPEDVPRALLERLDEAALEASLGVLTLEAPCMTLGAKDLLHMASCVLEAGRPGAARVGIRPETFGSRLRPD